MNNENSTQQEIINRFNKLPSVVRDAITDSGWENKIRIIGNHYDLTVGQAGTLETETFLVMLGLTSPDDFIEQVTSRSNISQDIAQQIATDVNSQIFAPIRSHLIALQQAEAGTEASQKASTAGIAGVDGSDAEQIAFEQKKRIESEPQENVKNDTTPTDTTPVSTAPASPNTETSEEKKKDSLVENKLRQVTSATRESETITAPSESTAPKIDPYREPLDTL